MIAIIDYDAGNLKSVKNALNAIGEQVIVTRDQNELLSADQVILPGVGAFGAAMKKLEEYHLVSVIKEIVKRKIPFLGICLGMQLMFEQSEESEGVKGLCLLPGEILKFPEEIGLKIPQIGWNMIQAKKDSRLFQGIGEEPYVYFVHSYYLKAKNKEDVSAVCEYGITFDCAVEQGNIFACQFHPEKSGDTGLKILKNFASIKRG